MDPSEIDGPLMLAATSLLRPGPSRVGSIGKVALPRAVRVNVLLAGAAFALPGAILGAILGRFIHSFIPTAWGAIAGIVFGYVVVSWSPLKGESFFAWVIASLNGRRGRVDIQCAGVGAPAALAGAADDDDPTIRLCPKCDSRVTIGPTGRVNPHTVRRQVFIGIAPMPVVTNTAVTLMCSTVPVTPGTYDLDGIRVENPARRHVLDAWAAGALPEGMTL